MATYKIAIVEDDHAVQLMYKLKLEHAGFRVAVASNGQAGLELAEQFVPDLILLDLQMPVMGGAEMLARLRAADWGSDMRVIILANTSKQEAPQALRFLHVDRYIEKAHYTPSQVVTMVNEVLALPNSERHP
jgi:two-component system response regulator AdeR